MVDTFSPKKRSWIMTQVKSAGNKSTEENLVIRLRRLKIKGWRRNYSLFGKPDIVFPRQRIALFVDGCFWHGHPKKCRMPSTNRAYWTKKIARNIARDKQVTRILQKKGWKVIRIWEDRVKKPSTMGRIQRALLEYEKR